MSIPHILIDAGSSTPAYRQIADQLRVEFVEGRVAPLTPLPSMRLLATTLEVHCNTVARAYQQLASEGWLELGPVVLPRMISLTAGAKEKLRREVESAVEQACGSGITKREIATELERQALALRR
jgi:GntR family transcriptional regulator